MSREVSDVLVSPAEWTKGRWLLNAADFECHDPIRLARKRAPYDAPVWIDVGEQGSLANYAQTGRTSASTFGPEAGTGATGTRISRTTSASTHTPALSPRSA